MPRHFRLYYFNRPIWVDFTIRKLHAFDASFRFSGAGHIATTAGSAASVLRPGIAALARLRLACRWWRRYRFGERPSREHALPPRCAARIYVSHRICRALSIAIRWRSPSSCCQQLTRLRCTAASFSAGISCLAIVTSSPIASTMPSLTLLIVMDNFDIHRSASRFRYRLPIA